MHARKTQRTGEGIRNGVWTVISGWGSREQGLADASREMPARLPSHKPLREHLRQKVHVLGCVVRL